MPHEHGYQIRLLACEELFVKKPFNLKENQV